MSRKGARLSSLTEFLTTGSPMDKPVLLKITTYWHFPCCYSSFEIVPYKQSRIISLIYLFPQIIQVFREELFGISV